MTQIMISPSAQIRIPIETLRLMASILKEKSINLGGKARKTLGQAANQGSASSLTTKCRPRLLPAVISLSLGQK